MLYQMIMNIDNRTISNPKMTEVDILVSSFDRLNQVYDWYLAEHIMAEYDVFVLADDELDIIVENYLKEVDVWEEE